MNWNAANGADLGWGRVRHWCGNGMHCLRGGVLHHWLLHHWLLVLHHWLLHHWLLVLHHWLLVLLVNNTTVLGWEGASVLVRFVHLWMSLLAD